MGPGSDNSTSEMLLESFVHLLTHGGKPLRNLKRLRENLPFLTPGIIDTTNMAERPDVELFGPILQVIRVPDFASAIAEANNTRFGLSASLIGGSPDDFELDRKSTRLNSSH